MLAFTNELLTQHCGFFFALVIKSVLPKTLEQKFPRFALYSDQLAWKKTRHKYYRHASINVKIHQKIPHHSCPVLSPAQDSEYLKSNISSSVLHCDGLRLTLFAMKNTSSSGLLLGPIVAESLDKLRKPLFCFFQSLFLHDWISISEMHNPNDHILPALVWPWE